ncbi:MAG: helix-turn-helix transcriptional regulator [Candidatus Marinimicrobia bacterium]|nr:helix-turn-helix transcriptional regulator [Candidatus Neomarinimicrobiota bacterium]
MTNAEITLLGILNENPNHAYQLEHLLQEKNLKDKVDLAFSSIYATLKKLEKRGMVLGHIQKLPKQPEKKIYSITEKGKQELIENLKQNLSKPEFEKSSFELCLHFSNFIPKLELKEILKIYEAELTRMIQNQIKEITILKTEDPVKRALFNRSLKLWQAEKQWLKELIILI